MGGLRALVIRYASLVAALVLGLGVAMSAIAGVPPWGGDESWFVRAFVVVFGLSLPTFELLTPALRRRAPEAFPERPKRWSRSALWALALGGLGWLVMGDYRFAGSVLLLTGFVYVLEATALRSLEP